MIYIKDKNSTYVTSHDMQLSFGLKELMVYHGSLIYCDDWEIESYQLSPM